MFSLDDLIYFCYFLTLIKFIFDVIVDYQKKIVVGGAICGFIIGPTMVIQLFLTCPNTPLQLLSWGLPSEPWHVQGRHYSS